MEIKGFHPYPGYAGFNVSDDNGNRYVGSISYTNRKLFAVRRASRERFEADSRGGHIRPTTVVDGRFVGRNRPVWIALSDRQLAAVGPKLLALLEAHIVRHELATA